MKAENAILEKSFQFSVRIVRLYKYVVSEHKEYVLSKQLLRSGTNKDTHQHRKNITIKKISV